MHSANPPLDDWLHDIKDSSAGSRIGIFFTHNGVVRGTSRDGRPVEAMEVSFDPAGLRDLLARVEAMPGVVGARAWVNEGSLSVGDDIVWALVAGDVRTNVFKAWETLARAIKYECSSQREILKPPAD